MRYALLGSIGAMALALAPAASAKPRFDPSCAIARTTFTPARAEAARAVLRSAVQRGYAPGAILLVERRGRIVISEIVGMADAERKAPMRADSLFRLYSMTKPVTTLAALQLVDQGKLGLDDPVSRYIPAFAKTPVFVSGTDAATLKVEPQARPLTVRDLLRHTAGMTYKADGPTLVQKLYAFRGVDTGSGADIAPLDGSPRVGSSRELAERIAGIPLLHQPGSKYSYGNAVDVLGAVIEIAGGARLGTIMQRQIFAPLGMRDTGFSVAPSQIPRFTAAYGSAAKVPGDAPLFARIDTATTTPNQTALVDDPTKSPYLLPRPIDYGGAGLVGTAGDYLRFTQALRQQGQHGKGRILSRSLAADMMRNQLPAAARTPQLAASGLGFGLGLAVRDGTGTMPVSFPQCGSFWAGAASTYFWVDPVNETSGVLMTQVFGGDVKSVWLDVLDTLYAGRPKA